MSFLEYCIQSTVSRQWDNKEAIYTKKWRYKMTHNYWKFKKGITKIILLILIVQVTVVLNEELKWIEIRDSCFHNFIENIMLGKDSLFDIFLTPQINSFI